GCNHSVNSFSFGIITGVYKFSAAVGSFKGPNSPASTSGPYIMASLLGLSGIFSVCKDIGSFTFTTSPSCHKRSISINEPGLASTHWQLPLILSSTPFFAQYGYLMCIENGVSFSHEIFNVMESSSWKLVSRIMLTPFSFQFNDEVMN